MPTPYDPDNPYVPPTPQPRPLTPRPKPAHDRARGELDDATRAAILQELDEKLKGEPLHEHVAHPNHAADAVLPAEPPVPPIGFRPPQLRALTSLRFPAALMVVIGHSYNILVGKGQPWQLAHAVTFFFILSGFAMAYVYPALPAVRVGRFYLGRAIRIWPVYLLSLALIVALDPLVRNGASTASYMSNFFLIQNWFEFSGPLHALNNSINSYAWTCSTLIPIYLLFPLLIYRWEKTWYWKLAISFAVVLFMFWAADNTDLAEDYYNFGGYKVNRWIYSNFLVRQFEFVLGMAAALAWQKLQVRWRPSLALATTLESVALGLTILSVTILTALIAYPLMGVKWIGMPFVVWILEGSVSGLFFVPLVILLAMQRGWISRILSHPILVFLGSITYEIYLLQFLFLKYYKLRINAFPDFPRWVYFPILLAMTLLSAWFVSRFLAEPLRNWVRSRTSFRISFGRFDLRRRFIVGTNAALLAGLVALWIFLGHYRTNVALASDDGLHGTQAFDVEFGRFNEETQFILRGASVRKTPTGIAIHFVWESSKRQPLDYTVQIHLLSGPDTKPVALHSQVQDPNHGMVEAGAKWDQYVHVPGFKLKGARFVGIGLNKPGEMLMADRGLRDWENRRLLIPLPGTRAIEAAVDESQSHAAHLGD